MKYVLLLYQDRAFETEWEAMDADARGAVLAEFEAFTQAAEQAGVEILGGYELALSHTATIVKRTAGDEELVITDGPFAEVTEHLGGYFEVEAPDLDHVLQIVGSLPVGTTEIRPIVEDGSG